MTQTYFSTQHVPYQIKEGLEGAATVANLSQAKNCFNAYEVNPAIGCGFGCRYCSAHGQGVTETHLPVIIYKDYPAHLASFIKEQSDPTRLIFDASPKTDFFSSELIESGVTSEILKVFLDTGVRFFSLTKAGLPPRDIQDLLIKTRSQNQIIISSGLPNVLIEKILEPGAATSPQRMAFAKFCTDNGITTTGVIAPYLPLWKDEDNYRDDVLNRFKSAGITHCSIDVFKGSAASIRRMVDALPEYCDKYKELYFSSEKLNGAAFEWSLVGGGTVTRYNADANYVRQTLLNFKKTAQEKGMTISACNDTCKFVATPAFNREAVVAGYNCVGFARKKKLAHPMMRID